MSRNPKRPRFPDTPGRWLAWFRYRASLNNQTRLSHRSVAEQIGVSEATLRRWETNAATPRRNDIYRLAETYDLAPLETQFLETAFASRGEETPPDKDLFVSKVTEVLSVDFPAAVLDSLFYLRAWNSYAAQLGHPTYLRGGAATNTIEWSFRTEAVAQWDDRLDRRSWYRLEEFWFSTANLCGSSSYRELVARLAEISPTFEERWLDLGSRLSNLQVPLGGVVEVSEMFVLVPLTLIIPPVYHLRLLLPVDDMAKAALAGLRSKGPAEVQFGQSVHWSLDDRP